MMPSTPPLSRRVKNYIKYRPRYPQAVLDLLQEECALSTDHLIADIGSGTGLLAELFLQNGNSVQGVEPDPDMRAGAAQYLGRFSRFHSIAAMAEATTLADHSVDFVTVGQAFHWFDTELSRREFRRILAPQGWVVLVWNIQRAQGTPFQAALQQFWQTTQFSKPAEPQLSRQRARVEAYRLDFELARRELLEPFFRPGVFQEQMFENPLICDLVALKGRIFSNAPALQPGDPDYTTMLAALEEIFWTHQTNERVTIEHDTRVVYGQLPPG